MKLIISFWFVCLAITAFFVSAEETFTKKEKLQFGAQIMVFVTIAMIASIIMVSVFGGADL